MSKKFTHENVPQDIAKKFPALQAKKIVTKDQVPAHVIVSATKNAPAGTVAASVVTATNAAEGTAPVVVVAKPTVVHHAPAAHVVKHAVVAAKPVVVVQQPVVVAGKPVVVNSAAKPLSDSKAVSGSAHKAPAAKFTHENVPADIHKKFPTLKGKVQPKAAENTQEQGKPESS